MDKKKNENEKNTKPDIFDKIEKLFENVDGVVIKKITHDIRGSLELLLEKNIVQIAYQEGMGKVKTAVITSNKDFIEEFISLAVKVDSKTKTQKTATKKIAKSFSSPIKAYDMLEGHSFNWPNKPTIIISHETITKNSAKNINERMRSVFSFNKSQIK